MKLIIGLLLSVLSVFATGLTGTIKNPDGTNAVGTLYLSMAQQGALSASGGCGGPIEVVPTYQVAITVNGTVTGNVYGNDCILPQGTYYNVKFVDNNGNVIFIDNWVITGTTLDVGTIISTVVTGTTVTLGQPGVVLTIPLGNQTITQPGGTALSVNNLTITANFIAPGGAQCTTAGCTGFASTPSDYMTTDTAQTVTGSKTWQSPAKLAANGSVDVGTAVQPFQTGWFNYQVISPVIKMTYNGGGTVGSPVDFATWQAPSFDSVHASPSLYNSSGNSINEWLFTGNDSGGHPYYLGFIAGGIAPFPAYVGDATMPTDLGISAAYWDNLYITNIRMKSGGLTITPSGNPGVTVTLACSSGQYVKNITISAGIVTAAACGI